MTHTYYATSELVLLVATKESIFVIWFISAYRKSTTPQACGARCVGCVGYTLILKGILRNDDFRHVNAIRHSPTMSRPLWPHLHNTITVCTLWVQKIHPGVESSSMCLHACPEEVKEPFRNPAIGLETVRIPRGSKKVHKHCAFRCLSREENSHCVWNAPNIQIWCNFQVLKTRNCFWPQKHNGGIKQ